MIKELLKRGLVKFGFQIQRIRKTPQPYIIQQWEEDEQFREMMKHIEGHTLVDTIRCFMLYQFVKQTIHIPGDVAEVGVYKGGTARLLSETLSSANKKVHLFDTFTGMPPTDPLKDIHTEGDFGDTSLATVKSYLQDCNNVHYHAGVFPYTAAGLEGNFFSFVHIDADIYKSVLHALTFFYPRLWSNGIMVCDDYGFLSCPGAKAAVDEFFLDKPEQIIYLPTGQCFIVRL